MIDQINAAGGNVRFAWLPALVPGSLYKGSPGPITGNDHMVMLDDNNLQIADILIGWIDAHVKRPGGGNCLSNGLGGGTCR